MEKREQGFMSGERDSTEVRSGKWGSITKEQFRSYDTEHAVAIPLFQGIVAGIAVGVPVLVLMWKLSGLSVALFVGLFAGSVVFGVFTIQGIFYARTGLEHGEWWESEALSLGQAQSAAATVGTSGTVKIEVVEQREGACPQMRFDELGLSLEALRMIARPDIEFSKRALMELGFGEDTALKIVRQLEEQEYIHRAASNEAATWTRKGVALCRAFGGGGGGGGEQVDDAVVDVAVGEGGVI